jgi:hypothetical protein
VEEALADSFPLQILIKKDSFDQLQETDSWNSTREKGLRAKVGVGGFSPFPSIRTGTKIQILKLPQGLFQSLNESTKLSRLA